MRKVHARVAAGVLLAASALGAVAGCGSSAPSGPVRVTVLPGVSSWDQPQRLRISGLAAGERVTVRITSTDATGMPWSSAVSYRAGADGIADAGMGPVWSMLPQRTDGAPGYQWASGSRRFTATVDAGGDRVATAMFRRTFPPLVTRTETLAADGFAGRYWQPAASGSAPQTAILVFGGPAGGFLSDLLPRSLAAHGYAVLSLAYFGCPGLPPELSRIPLEYFARALTWLATQPGVDRARVAVLGVSRGSEAAQLLGVHYPRLVHAVIATVPSSVSLCSYPSCDSPAWTLRGKALPYTRQVNDTAPAGDPGAIIQDQRISGPVFLACGAADQTWESCQYGQAIITLLGLHNDRWAHVLYVGPGAGHAVGELVPYEPRTQQSAASFAPSYQAIQQAYTQVWPYLLKFLATFAATGN